MRGVFLLCIFVLLLSCESPADKMEVALYNGELSKAEALLSDMSGSAMYRYSSLLIDEYLAIGNVDKAIYVFNYLTPHCSMYEIQFSSLYSSASYTKENAKKIYNALLDEERYDECWSFHPLSYENEEYPGNAADYFSYMSDVIVHLCAKGKFEKARQFMLLKRVCFLKNVDNHEWGSNYPDCTYSIMCDKLDKVYYSLIF